MKIFARGDDRFSREITDIWLNKVQKEMLYLFAQNCPEVGFTLDEFKSFFSDIEIGSYDEVARNFQKRTFDRLLDLGMIELKNDAYHLTDAGAEQVGKFDPEYINDVDLE